MRAEHLERHPTDRIGRLCALQTAMRLLFSWTILILIGCGELRTPVSQTSSQTGEQAGTAGADENSKAHSRHTDDYLEKLFSSPDDSQLVDRIFIRISQQCDGGDLAALQQLPKEQKVVLDVWGSFGIIGNGGFRYLFGSGLADLSGIAYSFDAIGVPAAAQAFREAISLFPNSKPPADVDARLEYLDRLGARARDRLARCSEAVWDSDRAIKRNLANYVRTHRQAFVTTKPSRWENLSELTKKDLPPPLPGASEDEITTWLASIDAHCLRRDLFTNDVSTPFTLPSAGNPIVTIALSDKRRTTDDELEQMARHRALQEVCEITLDGTYVSKRGVAQLIRFPNLQVIRLSRTDARNDWLKPLTSLRRARKLDLSQTEITNDGLDPIAAIESLEDLSLQSTGVSDRGLAKLAELPNLTSLDLSSTGVRGDGLSSLKQLPLKELRFFRSELTDEGLHAIRDLQHLKNLELRKSEIGDAAMRFIGECRTLEHLDLSSTGITDAGLKFVANLTQLQSLELSNTPITGVGFVYLPKLTTLEELGLHATQVNDEALAHLGKCTSLCRLSLSNTQITDGGLKYLVGLTRLKELNLHGTAITGGKELRELATLRSIEQIYFATSLADNPNVLYLQQHLPAARLSFY